MYVFFDSETTGVDLHHQVWEMAYAIDHGEIQASVVEHTLVGADPMALAVNKYFERIERREPDWRRSARFELDLQVALNLNKASNQQHTLVCAQPGFDTGFLRRRWGWTPWHYRLLDIESYAMPLWNEEKPLGLAEIAMRLQVDAPDHTSRGDVHSLRECFWELQGRYAFMAWNKRGMKRGDDEDAEH